MKKHIIILQAAALMLSACAQKTDVYEPAGEQEQFENVLTEMVVTVPDLTFDDGTKTSVGPDFKFTWNLEDRIGFWPEKDAVKYGDPAQSMFYVNSVNGNSASFKANGWGLLCGKTYYSNYPYDEYATYQAVTVDYTGQRQIANESTAHLGQKDYLHSSKLIPDEVATSLEYKHLGCCAKFVISVPGEYASSTFTKLSLTTTDAVMVASAVYNPSQETISSYVSKGMTKSFSVDLGPSANPGITCNASNQLVVYAMMSPAQWANETVTVTLTRPGADDLTGTFRPSRNQEANRAYGYTDISVEGPGDGYTDLSKTESSNCYIVTAPGKYKFKAVKGNSSTSVGDVKSTFIIWQTNQVDETHVLKEDSSLKYENGYVYFETLETLIPGNACIAVSNSQTPGIDQYDEFKGEGEVLWSWNIWVCTSTPGTHTYDNGKTLMDRNLCAISPNDKGMLYQWGRKDPFRTDVRWSSSTNPSSPYAYHIRIFNTDHGAGESIPASLKNPRTIILGANGAYHWDNQHDLTLWGSTKTMYDPCPVGYKVMDEEFKGYSGKGQTIEGQTWPATGTRTDGNGEYANSSEAQYWTNKAKDDSAFPNHYVGWCLNINSAEGTVSYCAAANPVRCQKIQ